MTFARTIFVAAALAFVGSSIEAQEVNGDEARALCPDVPEWKTVVYNRNGESKCWESVDVENKILRYFVAEYDRPTGIHMNCVDVQPVNGRRVLFNISGEGKCWEEARDPDGTLHYRELSVDDTAVASGPDN